jgi:hypothetical protein
LAKSRPTVVICIADGSHFARECLMAFTLWHLDAVSGSHPPHLLLGGGLNLSMQHFILEGKDGVRNGTKIS